MRCTPSNRRCQRHLFTLKCVWCMSITRFQILKIRCANNVWVSDFSFGDWYELNPIESNAMNSRIYSYGWLSKSMKRACSLWVHSNKYWNQLILYMLLIPHRLWGTWKTFHWNSIGWKTSMSKCRLWWNTPCHLSKIPNRQSFHWKFFWVFREIYSFEPHYI